MRRLVHLRPPAVYWEGKTKTRCGTVLHGIPESMVGPVVHFDNVDCTADREHSTCSRCLEAR